MLKAFWLFSDMSPSKRTLATTTDEAAVMDGDASVPEPPPQVDPAAVPSALVAPAAAGGFPQESAPPIDQASANAPASATETAARPPKRTRTEVSKPSNAINDEPAEFYFEGGLRKVKPYWYVHQTHAKGRWIGKTVLDLFSVEFQDQSPAYYKRAIESGKICINGKKVGVDYIVRNGNLVCHSMHRHEPPVSAKPIRVVHQSADLLVVDKPASIPVHPSGRYHHNTVTGILTSAEHGFKAVFPANRLDRLTSGILLLALEKSKAAALTEEMVAKDVRKTYLCRVKGEFPTGTISCSEPIYTTSHKLGINMVSPKGKPCQTEFLRLSYNGRTSVVQCTPVTGRTHQIRVHLQYLGFPIANDPLYCCANVWGPDLGKGGVSDDVAAEVLQRIRSSVFPFSDQSDGDAPSAPARTPASGPVSTSEGAGDLLLAAVPSAAVPSAVEGGSALSVSDFPCPECQIRRPDPTVEQMEIYLHSWKYSGPNWAFETPMPEFAREDFDGDRIVEERFWKAGGRWCETVE
ncbi:RNA pseudouridylate synthase domain-containing protein 2 [Zopfochytrium polystomum]|nr:RNA pseudouridylate synthase domain-containing protein 2 [Zopfochytrium polystomum]